MKKPFFIIVFTLCAFMASYSQTTTNYGTSSGTLGSDGSYFGYYSGNAVSSTGYSNSFFGSNTGRLTTTGYENAAFGAEAMHYNTTGRHNNAFGFEALLGNTTGDGNNAFGFDALAANSTGSGNTAIGDQSLSNCQTANYNTALGSHSLYYTNNSGIENTGIGYFSLYSNSSGYGNTSTGAYSMYQNLTGYSNSAFGSYALNKNTSGVVNTAIGNGSLNANTTGNFNTANGGSSLLKNTTGSYNIAVGGSASESNTTGQFNTSVGYQAFLYSATGSYNTAIGNDSGPSSTYTNLSNTTALGYQSRPTASNQVRIGNSSVTSIGGQVGWSTLSDGRFKKEIKEDVSGLDFINQLRPVSYAIDKDALEQFLGITDDKKGEKELQTEGRKIQIRQTGFVAQEVAEVIKKSGFVFHGVESPQNENDHYSIRYAEFVVPLVKAVQELNSKIEDQQNEIESLKDQIAFANSNGTISSDVTSLHSKNNLYQNIPNPSNGKTIIPYSLQENSHGQIFIFDLNGNLKKTLTLVGNEKSIEVQSGELSPGVYVYSLVVNGSWVAEKRMVVK